MIGLYVLLLLAAWFIAVCVVVTLTARKLVPKPWRILVGVVAVVVLFPLPLIDEIVGGVQFAHLCDENAKIKVDRNSARGRVVYRADVPPQRIKGTWVPVLETKWRFVDARSGETVVSYSTFDAGPGLLHVSGGPLLFKGYCDPGGHVNPRKLLDELGVSRVERSEIKGSK